MRQWVKLLFRLGLSSSQFARLNAGLVLLCCLLLAVALVLEYGWGLEPCLLCMVQRFWVVMIGLTAALSLVLRTHGWHRRLWGVATMLSALCGGGFAIRQLWLQSLPPEEQPACSLGVSYVLNYMPLTDAIAVLIQGSSECGEVLFRFLGLSIPGWSLVGFVGLLLLASLHLGTERTEHSSH